MVAVASQPSSACTCRDDCGTRRASSAHASSSGARVAHRASLSRATSSSTHHDRGSDSVPRFHLWRVSKSLAVVMYHLSRAGLMMSVFRAGVECFERHEIRCVGKR
eukprot:49473-Rhodomonas_salina.1